MVILGSTGSIGTNALELCRRHSITVEALSCGSNVELLNEQIIKFNPKFVCIKEPKDVKKVKHKSVFVGEQGILDMLGECKSDKVVNSLVGFVGLAPSLKVQELGKKLALANKESLVVGGKFINSHEISPIDSEHFGLKFLLQNHKAISRLIITASGGAFYKTPLKALKNVTPNDALKHPNWSMGAKITIDSASMANKLFEIMEAFWLYDTSCIEAVVEPTSMVHALVEFIDGSTTAHISKTDMKLAIAHAILDQNLNENIVPCADLFNLKQIKFHPINLKKYPIFSLKDQVLDTPDLGVVVNAANEVGVFAFLRGECGFLDISRVVLTTVDKFKDIKIYDKNELFVADSEARAYAKKILNL
ncbi:1-deoxy-D-xylulose-5-phosphate reductoisomerase [Campylobacter sp. faydin G-105]|uniref:1-deoxy-D-xylulose-5-phosphate reductoisomerase n=1 Tax=Campylobacter anatolicus TaxID=2829105 RepID=UPI001BA0890D|nr:1-deoxy-D-xylulose-5-phosphate reductoisomerase [Campylobacter anatolicus]MBR8462237.1 1-deoxy-D-xylulose-5-phosphate reductoisomerase [Campylobacter anatolicus]